MPEVASPSKHRPIWTDRAKPSFDETTRMWIAHCPHGTKQRPCQKRFSSAAIRGVRHDYRLHEQKRHGWGFPAK